MKKIKLLTIDDEVDFLGIVKNYFSLRGFEVFTASRGVVGLEILEKEKPDVAFIDLKLPGIDGDQIMQQIQKINPDTKVIMITAFKDDGQTRRKMLEAGIYAYFEKPIESFKELEATVKKAAGEAA